MAIPPNVCVLDVILEKAIEVPVVVYPFVVAVPFNVIPVTVYVGISPRLKLYWNNDDAVARFKLSVYVVPLALALFVYVCAVTIEAAFVSCKLTAIEKASFNGFVFVGPSYVPTSVAIPVLLPRLALLKDTVVVPLVVNPLAVAFAFNVIDVNVTFEEAIALVDSPV